MTDSTTEELIHNFLIQSVGLSKSNASSFIQNEVEIEERISLGFSVAEALEGGDPIKKSIAEKVINYSVEKNLVDQKEDILNEDPLGHLDTKLIAKECKIKLKSGFMGRCADYCEGAVQPERLRSHLAIFELPDVELELVIRRREIWFRKNNASIILNSPSPTNLFVMLVPLLINNRSSYNSAGRTASASKDKTNELRCFRSHLKNRSKSKLPK